MRVLKVFNNNVVLAAEDDGRQLVVTGRGLGFGLRPGQRLDETKVVRRFVPEDSRDPGNFGMLVAAIPAELLTLADTVLDVVHVEGVIASRPGSTTVVALADHLAFAMGRLRDGIEVTYPLRAEIAHLYPHEMAAGDRIVQLVNARLAAEDPELLPLASADGAPHDTVPQLDPEEAVAVALHLVNAGFASGDLSATYRMTGVINQVFDVIERFYDRPFERSSVNAARFITHLRYFFVRASHAQQVVESSRGLAEAITQAYPRAHGCAVRIRALLELRLGHPITEDETAYLTLHIARLTQPGRTKEIP